MNAAIMTPREKLQFIQGQISEIRAGLLTFIQCPYCGKENVPETDFLCCELFGQASAAILDRLEKQDAIAFLSTIQDKAN
jgi:hypothetical protein